MIRILLASGSGEPPVLSSLPEAGAITVELPQPQGVIGDLASLLMDLSMDVPSVTAEGIDASSSVTSLSTAHLLFLGESYAQAFLVYWDLQCTIKGLHLSVEQEQLRVSAIIGCLKSATTEEEHRRALGSAQDFVDTLEEDIDMMITFSPAPSARLVLQEVYDGWQDKSCATAKIIFDILTLYKKARTWISATQIRWAHNITVHEWTCMRLVRIPAWDLAVPFLNNNPVSQVDADSVFSVDNVRAIISWATDAIDNFGSLYDQQLQQLAPWSGLSVTPRRVLLFWRLGFYAKHSQPCPMLWAKLSPDITFVATSEQTTCIVARMLLEDLPIVERDFTHLNLLMRLHWMRNQADKDAMFSRLWQAMREAMAPSFEERAQNG